MIDQPGHAQRVEFVVEELHAELSGQEGHVLDDGEAHPPLGVLGQLDDGRQEGLGQLLDADHFVDAVQVGDDVEADLGALVLQLAQEQGQQVLDGAIDYIRKY